MIGAVLTTSFDEHLRKISVNNRVGNNIETVTSEFEAKIEIKLDKIKAYHIENINYFDMKLSDIT